MLDAINSAFSFRRFSGDQESRQRWLNQSEYYEYPVSVNGVRDVTTQRWQWNRNYPIKCDAITSVETWMSDSKFMGVHEIEIRSNKTNIGRSTWIGQCVTDGLIAYAMFYAEWWTKRIFIQRLLFIRWHLCTFSIHEYNIFRCFLQKRHHVSHLYYLAFCLSYIFF